MREYHHRHPAATVTDQVVMFEQKYTIRYFQQGETQQQQEMREVGARAARISVASTDLPRPRLPPAALSLEDEAGADLVGRAGGGGLVEALGIESETEGGFDARAEGLGVACGAGCPNK